MKELVTKESIHTLLQREHIREHVISRALVGLFLRQTSTEQSANTTRVTNGVGFASMDARHGCLTAKYYIANGRLEDWQIRMWTKNPNRLAKYHRQLNEIANEKLQQKENV